MNEAVREALARPGWVEATLLRISGDALAMKRARTCRRRIAEPNPCTKRGRQARDAEVIGVEASKNGKNKKTPRK